MWFQENNSDLERLAGIIWDLRREKFLREVFKHAERIWETEEQEEERNGSNEKALMKFDLETRQLILGIKEPQ